MEIFRGLTSDCRVIIILVKQNDIILGLILDLNFQF